MTHNLNTWQYKTIQHNGDDRWELTVVSGVIMLHTTIIIERGQAFYKGRLLKAGQGGVVPSWVDFRVIAYVPSVVDLRRR